MTGSGSGDKDAAHEETPPSETDFTDHDVNNNIDVALWTLPHLHRNAPHSWPVFVADDHVVAAVVFRA